MIGWYFDVVVGFLIRTVIRFVKLRSSKAWPVENGTISAATCPAAMYGGPVAELGYTYIHNGEYYSGVYRKAFMSKSFGRHDALPASSFLTCRKLYLSVDRPSE
jgi:hypothetical protein